MKGIMLTTPSNTSALHTSLLIKDRHSSGAQLRLALCQNENGSLSKCQPLFCTTIIFYLPIQFSVTANNSTGFDVFLWIVTCDFPLHLLLFIFCSSSYFFYKKEGWKDESAAICFLKGIVHKWKSLSLFTRPHLVPNTLSVKQKDVCEKLHWLLFSIQLLELRLSIFL